MRETWENTTQEERKDPVYVMSQEVGLDMDSKRILWVKARPDYETLFSIQGGLHMDGERRYWIEPGETEGNICGVEVDTGHMSTEVKIALPVSHNTLTSVEEYVQ